MATQAELIAAEDLALGAQGVLTGTADYDLDGMDEVALGTTGQTVIVDVADGAGIGEWDLRASRLALASVVRRRPEPYHQQIIEAARDEPIDELADPALAAGPPDEEEARNLARLIVYDDHERRSGLVRLIRGDGGAAGEFDRAPWTIESASDHQSVLKTHSDELALRKTIAVDGERLSGSLSVAIEVAAASGFRGTLELEWNINLLGGGANPAAYYRSGQAEWRHDSRGSVESGATLSFGNEFEGVDVELVAVPAAPVDWFAVETVSNSEAGFERVYQGSCVIVRWPVSLAAATSTAFITTLIFTQSRDRSAEERADQEAATLALE
jgi:alpha-amylase